MIIPFSLAVLFLRLAFSVLVSWTDAGVFNVLGGTFFDFFAGLRMSGEGAGLAVVVWAV